MLGSPFRRGRADRAEDQLCRGRAEFQFGVKIVRKEQELAPGQCQD